MASESVTPIGPALLRYKKYDIKLNHRLGAGSFGKVYLGEDTSTGKDSSTRVKICAKHLNVASVEFSQTEIDNMKRACPHDNIVTIHDSFEYMDDAWIVMEYCPGDTLDDYMRKHDRNVQTRVNVIYQMTNAVKHLHTLSPPLSHRDIKPKNIMVSPGALVKVCDFGLSKTIDASGSKNASFLGGTQSYMPPELSGTVLVDKYDAFKADIFSLGLVFIGTLTCSKDKNMEEFFKLEPRMDIGKLMHERRRFKQPVNLLRKKILAFRHQNSDVTRLMAFLSQMVAFTPVDRVDILEIMDVIADVYRNVSAICETPASDCADENPQEPDTSESSEDSTLSQPDVRPKEPLSALSSDVASDSTTKAAYPSEPESSQSSQTSHDTPPDVPPKEPLRTVPSENKPHHPSVRPKEPRQAQGSKGSSTMSPTAPLVSKESGGKKEVRLPVSRSHDSPYINWRKTKITPVGSTNMPKGTDWRVTFSQSGEALVSDYTHVSLYHPRDSTSSSSRSSFLSALLSRSSPSSHNLVRKVPLPNGADRKCWKAITNDAVYIQNAEGAPTHQFRRSDLHQLSTLHHPGSLRGALGDALVYAVRRSQDDYIIHVHRSDGTLILKPPAGRKWDWGLSVCSTDQYIVAVEKWTSALDVFSQSGEHISYTRLNFTPQWSSAIARCGGNEVIVAQKTSTALHVHDLPNCQIIRTFSGKELGLEGKNDRVLGVNYCDDGCITVAKGPVGSLSTDSLLTYKVSNK